MRAIVFGTRFRGTARIDFEVFYRTMNPEDGADNRGYDEKAREDCAVQEDVQLGSTVGEAASFADASIRPQARS